MMREQGMDDNAAQRTFYSKSATKSKPRKLRQPRTKIIATYSLGHKSIMVRISNGRQERQAYLLQKRHQQSVMHENAKQNYQHGKSYVVLMNATHQKNGSVRGKYRYINNAQPIQSTNELRCRRTKEYDLHSTHRSARECIGRGESRDSSRACETYILLIAARESASDAVSHVTAAEHARRTGYSTQRAKVQRTR